MICLRSPILVIAAFSNLGFAQTPASPVSPMETTQDLLARLTPEQKRLFDDAIKAYTARRYSDALTIHKQLLEQLKGDAVISRYAAEAALNSGDPGFALSTLKPIAADNPDDWQAAALLVHACAESGDAACRDSGIAHMLDLHQRGITPPSLRLYIVESVKVGEKMLEIKTSIEPFGPYRVYDSAEVFDKEGNRLLQITLESSDGDQIWFAHEHPKEAARGLRAFTLDGYRDTGLNSSGQQTQTHYTYKLSIVGQPPYETIRDEFVRIVNGKSTPISSRTNLIVP